MWIIPPRETWRPWLKGDRLNPDEDLRGGIKYKCKRKAAEADKILELFYINSSFPQEQIQSPTCHWIRHVDGTKRGFKKVCSKTVTKSRRICFIPEKEEDCFKFLIVELLHGTRNWYTKVSSKEKLNKNWNAKKMAESNSPCKIDLIVCPRRYCFWLYVYSLSNQTVCTRT